MALIRGFDGVGVQLTINEHLYTPSDINAFKIVVALEEDGDSGVELHCNDDDYKIADSVDFQPGSLLSIKLGYKLGSDYTKTYSNFVIQKPSMEYGEDGAVAVIKAYTKSGLLAASRPRKVYNKLRLGDIIKDIASRAQMDVRWNSEGAGSEILPVVSQANWSDRELLHILAVRYGYQLTFLGNTIVFDKVTYSETPTCRLVYRRGETGNIISGHVYLEGKKNPERTVAESFDPLKKVTESSESGQQDSEKVLGVSLVDGSHALVSKPTGNKTPVNASTSDTLQNWVNKSATDIQTALDGSSNPLDSVRNLLGGADPNDQRNLLSLPATMESISRTHANAFKFGVSKKKCGLELECVGNPQLENRQLVEVVGLANRDSGNWFISKTVHEVSKSGFLTHLELNRSRANLARATESTDKVNKKSAAAEDSSGAPKPKKVQVSLVNGKTARVQQ